MFCCFLVAHTTLAVGQGLARSGPGSQWHQLPRLKLARGYVECVWARPVSKSLKGRLQRFCLGSTFRCRAHLSTVPLVKAVYARASSVSAGKRAGSASSACKTCEHGPFKHKMGSQAMRVQFRVFRNIPTSSRRLQEKQARSSAEQKGLRSCARGLCTCMCSLD